jgi:anti-sigma regulatory factor (Ser/Thr protein kinase)
MAGGAATTPGTGTLHHEALFYRDPTEYVAAVSAFVHDGLAAGEPVMVAVPEHNLELLRAGLGAAAERVRFTDMASAGRNPSGIIPWVLHAFVSQYLRQRVRIIGEPIWPGRTATEYGACVQHEALINLAFGTHDATILCPYDAHRLDPAVLDDAARTHPVLVDAQSRWPSDGYDDPQSVAAAFDLPLAEPTGPVSALVFGTDDLCHVRRLVRDRGRRAGLRPERIEDLQIAINEIATNALAHGHGAGTLRVWPDEDGVVCEVRNDGARLTDPLAGRLPPEPSHPGGRGLMLVNRLCDLVQVRTDGSRTTVRLHLHR